MKQSATRQYREQAINSLRNGLDFPDNIPNERISEVCVRGQVWASLFDKSANTKVLSATASQELNIMKMFLGGDTIEEIKAYCLENNIKPNRISEAKSWFNLFENAATDCGRFIMSRRLQDAAESYIPDNRLEPVIAYRRKGGQKARKAAMVYWPVCAITNVKTPAGLETFHIVDFNKTRDNSLKNIIMLRADLNNLQAAGEMKLERIGDQVKVRIFNDDPEYLQYDGKMFDIPESLRATFMK